MDISRFIQEQIDDTYNDNGRELTRTLRAKAQERSWPFDLVRKIRVNYNLSEDSYEVVYPSGVKKLIEDLEYGTQSVPPNPVIRPFMNRLPDFTSEIQSSFESALIDSIDLGD